ncbi:tetratricopeptide repeat protein [Streptomyces scopuliridis]|uniref:tetratricopeptide repeat protein n=1 Tax=Streptomyces scopuliridis TaxID=452529 RepID=UPI00398CFDCB
MPCVRARRNCDKALTSLHNLAGVLDIERNTLGENHPSTLTTCHNLAAVLHHQEHHDLAAVEMAAVLSARRRVLGPEHPDTLSTQRWLDTINAARGEP